MSETTGQMVPDYVYTTYIHARPEQVWAALTDPESTARSWGHSPVSEWQIGGNGLVMRKTK